MPRDRFDKLSQYFHVNDSTTNLPRDDPGYDRLHHVRPVLDIVKKKCLENYKPHQNTSVDEAMIAFRGRLGFRQYLPAKPTNYGVKVWMRADSENGYANDIDVYTGKKGDEHNAQYGLTTRVVLNLTQDIANKNHIVNIDNYFTSYQLFEVLKQNWTYARGTARSNRKGFPSSLLHPKCVKNQGDIKIVQKGKTAAYAWKDKKNIFFLSTADDPTENAGQVKRRQKDGTQRQVPSPGVVEKYNIKMNGVDRSDQTRTAYPTYRMCKRWWTYIFFFLLDLSISNAFILMKESPNHRLMTKTGKDKDRSLLSFRMNLSKQLLGTYRATRKRRRVSNVDPFGGGHWPKESEKKGRCRRCSKDKKRSDVKWECTGCGAHLCVFCFEKYHRGSEFNWQCT
ncbi:piggyBac transposable element-derived protein 4-like [Ylistrum balloti]|uniref:piggyBac transposable element-derived protein 4-like n=1 Tax=Ylistrum balloti TaxID=509963 RepID=UPI002905D572|nr:piggyBac transposable element-derived protein 4-like [Ylistrum balloti]